jgi:succinyl-CoA synthetase alpha subunit
MAILAPSDSRILLHGIANPLARFQCAEIPRHGTLLAGIVVADRDELAGWSPGEARTFQSAHEAVRSAGANLSMVFSAPYQVKAAVAEAIAARIPLIIVLTEHVPVHDAILLRHLARLAGATLIGPNSSGLLSPGRVKAGFFVEDICRPGRIGIVSKSGSLAYAVMAEMKSAGLGVSTIVAIGPDAVKGIDFREPLSLFQADPETDAIVLLGEIGGGDEEKAASFIASSIAKPVVTFISGRSVSVGQSMGHANAIAGLGRGDHTTKVRAFVSAGVMVAQNIGDIPVMLKALNTRPT